MKLAPLLLLLFSLLSNIICSQKINVDSLYSIYNKPSNHDTVRIRALYHAAQALQKKYPDSSISMTKKVLKEAVQKGYIKIQPGCYNLLGMNYKLKSMYIEALEYMNKCIEASEKVGDKIYTAKAYNGLGQIYARLSDFKMALECFIKNIQIYDELKEPDLKKNGYLNIGNLYFKMANYQEALKYYKQCNEICIKTGDEVNVANSTHNMAEVYKNLGREDTALFLIKKALKIFEKLDSGREIAASYSSMASLYLNQHKLDSSLIYDEKALKISKELKDKVREVGCVLSIADVLNKQGKSAMAKQYALEAMTVAKSTGEVTLLRDCNLQLFEINKSLKNFEEAILNFENYSKLKDSVLSLQNKSAVLDLSYQYKYEKKNLADSLKLVEEKKIVNLQLSQEKNRRWTLLSILFLVMVFGVFIFNRYKVTKKQNKLIEQKEIETNRQKEIIELKQKEIVDSIKYASRIQKALMTSEQYINRKLDELT